MSTETDLLVESWKILQEYIPEKDKHKAGEHWVQILQDLGVEEETLDALKDSDDVMEEICSDALDEEPLYLDDEVDDEDEDEHTY